MMTSLVNERLIIANAVQEAHEIKKKLASSVIESLLPKNYTREELFSISQT